MVKTGKEGGRDEKRVWQISRIQFRNRKERQLMVSLLLRLLDGGGHTMRNQMPRSSITPSEEER
jgi:hypothetical protein